MGTEQFKAVTVVGAGTMGNGIAHVFAQYGNAVTLHDIKQEFIDRGMTAIRLNLDRQVKKGTLSEDQKAQTLTRIRTSPDLEEVCRGADLVIEAATENEIVKKQLFRDFDKFSSASTILASNTSSISITALAAVTSRPDKVIGMHFMNPVPVMKLVEVVRGLATSDETFSAIKMVSESLEKIPVEVNDYPGFVSKPRVVADAERGDVLCHGGCRGPRSD